MPTFGIRSALPEVRELQPAPNLPRQALRFRNALLDTKTPPVHMQPLKTTQNHLPHVLPHQSQPFDDLLSIAKVTFFVERSQFPLQLRTNVCLLGPSGVGKTHLARAVGIQMDVPTYYVNISTWSLLGSSQRGAAHTWTCIFQFLESCMAKAGAVIIVDEIDKVGVSDSTSWTTYLRSEVFDLLDWRIPRGLTDMDGEMISERRIAAAEEVLRNKTMIIGVGAFQHFWEKQDHAEIGFIAEQSLPQLPDTNDLCETLPRELSNRFGSNIISIPPLLREDYVQVLDSVLGRMPEFWRERYAAVARAKIDDAVRMKLGTRFFEECLLQTLVRERREIVNFQPETSPLKPTASIHDANFGVGMSIS